ncbi:MAG: hypothetical protein CV089_10020 [Nitrospira sp. WS110]|nr:hypothetical protein [Nitrospira sp. WS110]
MTSTPKNVEQGRRPRRRIGRHVKSQRTDGRIRRLAVPFGVAISYVDEGGVRRQVSDQNLR